MLIATFCLASLPAKILVAETREAQTVEIDYSGIIIMCHIADDKLVCVDHRFLLDGELRELSGRVVEAQFMEMHDGQSNESDQAILDRVAAVTDPQ